MPKQSTISKLTDEQLNKLKTELKTSFQIQKTALANLKSYINPEIFDRIEGFKTEHEANSMRDLGELNNLITDLADQYKTDIDISSGKVSDQLGSRGLPNQIPEGYQSPHEDLLGSLPRNSDSQPYANDAGSGIGARDLANAARPSGDARSWSSGSRSQDGMPEPEVGQIPGTNTTQTVWRFDNGSFVEQLETSDSNYRTVTIHSYEAISGEQSGETSLYDTNGLVFRTTYRVNGDGSSVGTVTSRQGGTYVLHIWEKDSAGNPVDSKTDSTSAEDVKKGTVTLPGTESGANSELARLMAMKFDHSKKASPPITTHVNPGDPDYNPNQKTNTINPGKGILDVEEKKSIQISRNRAKSWMQSLKDKVGGKVNPPGPGEG
jgi:hypothetical protein